MLQHFHQVKHLKLSRRTIRVLCSGVRVLQQQLHLHNLEIFEIDWPIVYGNALNIVAYFLKHSRVADSVQQIFQRSSILDVYKIYLKIEVIGRASYDMQISYSSYHPSLKPWKRNIHRCVE